MLIYFFLPMQYILGIFNFECQKTTKGFEISEPIREHAHKTICTVYLTWLEIPKPIRENNDKIICTVYLMGLEISEPNREHAIGPFLQYI